MSRPAPAQLWATMAGPAKPLGTPRPKRLGEPGAIGMVTYDHGPVNVVPSPPKPATPPLIVQHHRKDPT